MVAGKSFAADQLCMDLAIENLMLLHLRLHLRLHLKPHQILRLLENV